MLANEIALNLKYLIGLKHFFNINLGIGIFPCFYSNFDRESSLDEELNYASNKYPLGILLMDPATPKTRNT